MQAVALPQQLGQSIRQRLQGHADCANLARVSVRRSKTRWRGWSWHRIDITN
jgi:hypothetical protein